MALGRKFNMGNNKIAAKILRCGNCNEAVGEQEGIFIKIPCPKCKSVNSIQIMR